MMQKFLVTFCAALMLSSLTNLSKASDMVAVGEDCYFRLSNKLSEHQYKKSTSMTTNNDLIQYTP